MGQLTWVLMSTRVRVTAVHLPISAFAVPKPWWPPRSLISGWSGPICPAATKIQSLLISVVHNLDKRGGFRRRALRCQPGGCPEEALAAGGKRPGGVESGRLIPLVGDDTRRAENSPHAAFCAPWGLEFIECEAFGHCEIGLRCAAEFESLLNRF